MGLSCCFWQGLCFEVPVSETKTKKTSEWGKTMRNRALLISLVAMMVFGFCTKNMKAKEITRYSFLEEVKKMNPQKGEAFNPALDGLLMANTQVRVPSTCIPGTGEGVCEGDYVSASGACYGMVVVAANYYRRIVRRIGSDKEPITWWDVQKKIDELKRQNDNICSGIDWNVHNIDPNTAEGINSLCAHLREFEGEDFFKKANKKNITALRLSQVSLQTKNEEAIKGAALWHQIDQQVPGRNNLPIPTSGQQLHEKMEALRARLDKHGVATILWKHRDEQNPVGHAFLLYEIAEVKVKRGGDNEMTAWELRLYDPNIAYNITKRNKIVVYYLPSEQRMTFSKELIAHYTKKGVGVQADSEYIDGAVDELCETTPEVWNASFLARTVVYKLRRKWVPGQTASYAD